MKRIIEWLKESHRLQHLLLGVLIGFGSNGWYCTEYVAMGVAGSLEFKDYKYENKWDWIDFALTVVGVNMGYTIRYFVYDR